MSKQKEPSNRIQLAQSRQLSNRTTGLTKAEQKMLALERKRMLGLAIKARLGRAGAGGMSQIAMEGASAYAEVVLAHSDVDEAVKGATFYPYAHQYLIESLELSGGALKTLVDVTDAGIIDIIAGDVLVDDEPVGFWGRLFGRGRR